MPDPMIVLVPDIHVEDHPASLWTAEAQWIVANATANNIVAVIGLGDNVSDSTVDANMLAAQGGWDLIDAAGIPYLMAIGNHDYDGSTINRNPLQFSRFFGLSRFFGKSWYGGSMGDTQNWYIKITVGTRRYLLLALEIFPRLAAMAWAQSVISAHDHYEVIIATHGFLNADGSRNLHGDAWGPDAVGGNSDGQVMWDTLIKVNAHIILVAGGHFLATTSANRLDFGGFGNQVNQTFINHQTEGSLLGKDRIGLLTLQPGSGTIDMKTYSPHLDAYDATGEYTLMCRIDRTRGRLGTFG